MKRTQTIFVTPSTRTAVCNLQQALGLMGRADFKTSMENFPGDLIYCEEQVSIIILNCWGGGCAEHTPDDIPAFWRERQAETQKLLRNLEEQFEATNWDLLVYFECEVTKDTTLVAQEIIASLDSKKASTITAWQAQRANAITAAKISRLDGARRVGEEKWIRFLEIISEFTGHISRANVLYVLREEGWDDDAAMKAWKVASYHGIITNRHTNGTLYKAVLAEAGVRGEIPNVKLRRAKV